MIKKFFSYHLVFALIITISNSVLSQKVYDIHYVVIGSGFHEPLGGLEYEGKLQDVSSANTSARMMSKLFDSMGASNGIALISNKRKVITKKEIMDALSEMISTAQKSENPLIIFYYCGHGFTNGDLEAHFMTPGNFILDSDLKSYEQWYENSLPPLNLRENLDTSRIPYMMMIDSCDSGEEEEKKMLNDYQINSFGLETMNELMMSTYNIIKENNRMTGLNPVIFSAKAGESTSIIKHTFEDGVTRKVAPICRKTYIVLNKKLKNQKEVALSDFLVMMMDETVDPNISSINSSWSFDSINLNYLFKKD